MVWMALSGNQEYYGYDLQYMIAKGAKETFFMTSAGMSAVNDGSGYTPFEIEPPSFGDLAKTYPRMYPHGTGADTYLGPAGLGNQGSSFFWYISGCDLRTIIAFNRFGLETSIRKLLVGW